MKHYMGRYENHSPAVVGSTIEKLCPVLISWREIDEESFEIFVVSAKNDFALEMGEALLAEILG